MNARGHFWFALLIGAFALYVLKDFIELPFNFLALHSIFYIIGSTTILDYGFFDSYKKGIGHHSFWHSSKFLWILIIVLIPICISFYLKYNKYFLFDAPINIWSSLGFVFGGMAVHLIGDSLCSKLR
jgi:hypothetical protein